MKKITQNKNKDCDIKIIPIDDIRDLERVEKFKSLFTAHKRQLMERIEYIENKKIESF